MKKIIYTIAIIMFINSNYSLSNEIKDGLTKNQIKNAITMKCSDFGSVEYFNLNKKNSCLNLLKLGIKKDLDVAKKIIGQSLYNGFNLPKNKILGEKYMINANTK
jgi:hypothetical protein